MVDSVSKKSTKQCVVRTYATRNDVVYEPCSNLEKELSNGWKVVMCNPVGDRALEYILEKEIEE